MRICLAIAGSDAGGGAGIQADLKTFAAHGVHGTCAVTSVIAENTQAVLSVFAMPKEIIQSQIRAVMEDFSVDAVKIGLLPNQEAAQAVSDALSFYGVKHVVADPVLAATAGGCAIAAPNMADIFCRCILPHVSLVTPNLPEAEGLTGMRIQTEDDMRAAARAIHQMGAGAVLVKGGHLAGDACDLLFDGKQFTTFRAPRIQSAATHGTGCILSSAIAANLANGLDIPSSVAAAKTFITGAILHGLPIGHGNGPANPLYEWTTRKEKV